MDDEKVSKAIERQQLVDSLEQDFITTIDERISRYQELNLASMPSRHV